MSRRIFVALLILGALAAPLICTGVTLDADAYAVGTVKDTNSNPVEGATISFSGSPLTATTNSAGQYFKALPAGTYDVTASKSGYQPSTAYGIVFVSGQPTQVDFTLTGN